MAETFTPYTNGTSQRLVWWILAGFGVTIAGIVSFIITNISDIRTDMTAYALQAATRTEKVRVLEIEYEAFKRELGELRTKINEILIKTSQNESSIKLSESRLNTMSERLMTINNRLDQHKIKLDKVE